MKTTKTTIELPDVLFQRAKAAALRRRTTLKALLTHALEREVYCIDNNVSQAVFEVDEDGLPHLPSRGVAVTNELVNRLLDEEDA